MLLKGGGCSPLNPSPWIRLCLDVCLCFSFIDAELRVRAKV